MRKIIVIPARLSSTRLPNKLLLDLKGKTVLQRVYDQCLKVNGVTTFIATDSDKIKSCCLKFTENIIMTKESHQSGTDRIVEAIKKIDCDFVVNVQGDEPFIEPKLIAQLFDSLERNCEEMVSVMERITIVEELNNTNVVKVVVDANSNALYFSRSCIPFFRDYSMQLNNKDLLSNKFKFYRHVGIYGYKRDFLITYSDLNESELEFAEKLEQLRVLENGYKIKMVETAYRSLGIDTKEDYLNALNLINDEI